MSEKYLSTPRAAASVTSYDTSICILTVHLLRGYVVTELRVMCYGATRDVRRASFPFPHDWCDLSVMPAISLSKTGCVSRSACKHITRICECVVPLRFSRFCCTYVLGNGSVDKNATPIVGRTSFPSLPHLEQTQAHTENKLSQPMVCTSPVDTNK